MDMGTEATTMTDTTKIRTLARAKREPDAAIIALLEEALELARKGEMVDCVIAYTTGEDYWSDYKINSDIYAVAGYLIAVQNDIVGSVSED
jgi:hypothetical protein